MRRLLSGWVLLLVLPGGAATSGTLDCAAPAFDAGPVPSGGVLSHRFTLSNRGKAAIEITEVKPGCGCLRPHLDRPTLGPGEQAGLTLEVNTLTQAAGPNLWRATVRYRENGEPAEQELEIRARLEAVVSVQPASLVIQTQAAAQGTFLLTERLARPLTVRGVTTSSQFVCSACSAAVQDEGVWKRTITLGVLPGMPEGRVEGVLKVLTDDPKYPELVVPFTVVKRSPDRVQASPAAVSMVAGPGSPTSRIVLLEAGEAPVKVEAVEPGQPFLRCTWASGPGPRSTLRIGFEIDELPAGKSFDTQVRVRLKEPFPQVVDVPVHCARP